MRLPDRFLEWVGSGYHLDETPALRAVQGLSRDCFAAVLSGPTGVGKSLAAAWWAKRENALWVRSRAIVAMADWGDDWARVLRAQALVIDDVGTEADADLKRGWAARFDELLDVRIYGGRRTVITTNAGGKEFAALVGARVIDRLKEHGRWVSLSGSSLRGEVAPKERPKPESEEAPRENVVSLERMQELLRPLAAKMSAADSPAQERIESVRRKMEEKGWM